MARPSAFAVRFWVRTGGFQRTSQRRTVWRLRCETDDRTSAGGVPAEKQQRYVRLIGHGVSNTEACRLVGINRRTGTRWWYGRSVRNFRRGAPALSAGEDHRAARGTSQSRSGS